MPNYQLWLLNDDYSRHVLLSNTGNVRTWSRLNYRQVLNGIGSCTIDLVPNSAKIDDISLMKRLLVYRDGVIVYGGLLLRDSWNINSTAPENDTYRLYAVDHAAYAGWRCVPPSGSDEFEQRTDNLDDLAKAYVRYHAGPLAAAARQFSDLTVQADAGSAASDTVQARYDNLLTLLQALADDGGFDWRFEPSATGCEFKTAFSRWGTDRTKGNGVNDEAVFSLDRRNFSKMSYTNDLLGHVNYMYVLGQGEGGDKPLEERSNAGYITAYKRREGFVEASQLSLTSALQAEGDRHIERMRPVEAMGVQPLAATWPDVWDLGDLVTCYANRYGRTFSLDAKVAAIDVTAEEDSREIVIPELVKE